MLTTWGPRDASDDKVYAALAQHRAIFYTPTVCCPFRELHGGIAKLISRVGICINSHLHRDKLVQTSYSSDLAEVLIVDEAERLTNTGLDHLRDLFDRTGIGVILVGMPGIEKRLSRYPQLYSHVGFAHHYRPLQGDELGFVLTRHWLQLGLSLDGADFADAHATAAIARITGGNFRLLHRLFVQIERILKINDLSVITDCPVVKPPWEALAPLAVAGLQLGQVLDVDVHEAEVVIAKGALAFGGPFRKRLWSAVQALGLEDAPDAVAVEVQQDVADNKGEVVERETGCTPEGADDG